MKVVVLGSGPAGLLAVHAAAIYGADVRLFSLRKKSDLYGCQYLHSPIANLTTTDDECVQVDYRVIGTSEQYRAKVYGPTAPQSISVSADEYGTGVPHVAWDLRSHYDRLWEMYGSEVQEIDVRMPGILPIIMTMNPDLLVSTVPLPILCSQRHRFDSEEVWAIGDAPDRGQYAGLDVPPNTVLCNGTQDVSWYRAANVFGWKTVEWPGHTKPPAEGVARVRKPIAHGCTCLAEAPVRVLLAGRYGRWQKGVLSHTAFIDTLGTLGNIESDLVVTQGLLW